MNGNVPTILIDPLVLSREGLRRILLDAHFSVLWSDDAPPSRPIPGLEPSATPLVVISAGLPEAIDHIVEVRRLYPAARIALLMDPVWEPQSLVALRRCGVDTVVPRDSSYEAFIGSLRLVLDGSMVLPSKMADLLLTDPEEPDPACSKSSPVSGNGQCAAFDAQASGHQVSGHRALAESVIGDDGEDEHAVLEVPPNDYGLSLREMGVLDGLREGRSNKEIARELGITEATVKVHVKAILRKARVRNRTQVAMWASKLGLRKVHAAEVAAVCDGPAGRLDAVLSAEPFSR